MDKENKLILYKDEEGRVSVNTRLRNLAKRELERNSYKFVKRAKDKCVETREAVEKS